MQLGRRKTVLVKLRFDGAFSVAIHGAHGDHPMPAYLIALGIILGDQPLAGGLIGELVANRSASASGHRRSAPGEKARRRFSHSGLLEDGTSGRGRLARQPVQSQHQLLFPFADSVDASAHPAGSAWGSVPPALER
ncbi:hypothetical protein [Mesorhizobium amorphae]|uniref:Uncharacterized protein n=1 Tax=Mesorhizobium amorphae CCNWGS0123 TaxID=1082933 RepID=G6Y2J9_9HYPH|nr:hypothetical protein [Mesorhizobium amorphae]ANT54541.1 hypothetical protein A6B35_31500 [Mesorhizobium amorphae CCNWGS0123]EHH14049.1 hypothetical protein MEA186_00701 [Mesorhizobium amorphae CCNWGS0123]